MFRHNNEGYSFVEVLVGVVLVAVLVAVTGSQLLANNLQGYNANAVADLRNAAAAEKAFFTEWGVYVSSQQGGSPTSSGSIAINNFSTGRIWAHGISSTAPSATIPAPGFSISLSQGVGLSINTSAAGASYAMVSKHTLGDRCFAIDSDSREIYWVNGPVGAFLTTGDNYAVIAGTNDFVINGIGSSPAGACTGIQGHLGQTTWTTL